MSKFYKVSEDTIQDFQEVFKKKSFIYDVRFEFQGDEKQKKLIVITKIPDKYVFSLEKDIMVTFNEELFNVFDEESINILIEQEIDKIIVEGESGKIKLIKPDLTTFAGIVAKYGIQKVSRANQVEELYSQQVSDAQDEFIA